MIKIKKILSYLRRNFSSPMRINLEKKKRKRSWRNYRKFRTKLRKKIYQLNP